MASTNVALDFEQATGRWLKSYSNVGSYSGEQHKRLCHVFQPVMLSSGDVFWGGQAERVLRLK